MNFYSLRLLYKNKGLTDLDLKAAVRTNYSLFATKDNLQKSGNDSRMMATKNVTGGGTQTKTFQRLLCSPLWVGDSKQQSLYLSAVNIFLSITAVLGNSLILVALHKESSLHPPSKLFYLCLATTYLLVGLVSQPLYATYWMSLVPKQSTYQAIHYVECLCRR